MKRPADLTQLLSDLESEKPESSVVTTSDSLLIVATEDSAVRYRFAPEECKLLLSSTDSVKRLFEALDFPEETFVELYNLAGIDHDVSSELESWASTVDEM